MCSAWTQAFVTAAMTAGLCSKGLFRYQNSVIPSASQERKTLTSVPASEKMPQRLYWSFRVGQFRSMAKSVLVVDDNAAIRHVLCQVLTSEADFDVCGEAENGQDAIEKAQALQPDLIVMDLSMPVMNGIEAARALKALMPMVPVIMFSEYGDVLSEQEAESAGVSAVVSKSAHVSVLIEKARALLYPAAA
jgi:two-component system chemotaxis response regulator CheY